MIDHYKTEKNHQLKVSVDDDRKLEIHDDLSKWAKKFLDGRQSRIEVAGPIKLTRQEPTVAITDLDSTLEEEQDSFEAFWSRKGIK